MAEQGLSPRARVMLPACLILLLALSYWRLVLDEPELFQWSGATMGTSYQLKVASPGLDADVRAELVDAAERRLEHVNALMSTWREDSELSRFNAQQSLQPFAIAPETSFVIGVALGVAAESGGAFDVTVAPLVRAWGFGAGAAASPPGEAELQELRARVGSELLELDPAGPSLRKLRPDVEVDLSAIAKGYGVDELARLMLARGHRNFLVEIGGELRVHGLRPDGTPWRVAIEEPAEEVRRAHIVLPLRDRAMATSGDYRNYYEEKGVRISHTIDPRTGRPIRHGLASVTVIADEAVTADAWATALDVLGPEEGPALAERLGLAAYFIVREGETLRSFASSAFEALREAEGAGAQAEAGD